MVFLSFSQPFAKLENVFWDNVIKFKSDEACVEFRDTDIIKALVDVILPCHIFSMVWLAFFLFYKTLALLWKVVTIHTRAQNM